MKERVYAIDVLRALAIIGMVLSAQMLWNAELPAWMFHIQVPPPAFTFDPSVPGISWVDLVFPFFLFSMGAAFPLSLGRKAEAGASTKSVVLSVVQRWALLALFAIALANLRMDSLGDMALWLKSIVQLVVWGLFSMTFVRFSSLSTSQNRLLHSAGVVSLVAIMLLLRYAFGADVSVYNSDIIILILSNMALFGSLVWWFTRNNLLGRLAVLAIIIAFKIGSSIEGSWVAQLWEWTPVDWLFRFEYIKYLAIIIPGSIAGDLISRYSAESKAKSGVERGRLLAAGVVAFSVIVVNLWGLYTRNLSANFIISVALAATLPWLLKGDKMLRSISLWALFYLVAGLLIEPFEGGIRKDDATISYYLVTSGLAIMAIISAQVAIKQAGASLSWLVKCGQNPMVAYTVSGFVIAPILNLIHLSEPLTWFATLTPWCGFFRGVIVVVLMVALTILLVNKKIFWRT